MAIRRRDRRRRQRAGSLLHALPRAARPLELRRSSSSGRRRASAGRSRPAQDGATERHRQAASARLIAAKLHRLIEIGRDRSRAAPRAVRAAVQLGPLRLDPRRAAASVGDAPLALTTGEFEAAAAARLAAGRVRPSRHDRRTAPAARDGAARRPAQRRHAHLPHPQEAARRGRDEPLRVETTVCGQGLLPAPRSGVGGRDVSAPGPSPVVRLAPGRSDASLAARPREATHGTGSARCRGASFCVERLPQRRRQRRRR